MISEKRQRELQAEVAALETRLEEIKAELGHNVLPQRQVRELQEAEGVVRISEMPNEAQYAQLMNTVLRSYPQYAPGANGTVEFADDFRRAFVHIASLERATKPDSGSGHTNDYDNTASFDVNVPNSASLKIEQNFGAVVLDSSYSPNAWHQVCAIFNGSTGTLYVDGASVGTASNSNALASPVTFALAGIAGSGGGALTGGIAEVFSGNADWTSNISQIHTYLFNRWGVN